MQAWKVVCGVALVHCCGADDHSAPSAELKPRIAIIGSGIAGSATGYFLRRSFPAASFHVFEKEHEVGGRIKTISFDGNQVEAGASVIHVSNRYMREFVVETGLQIRTKSLYSGTMGLFDGEKLFFKSTGWSFLDSLTMLWRYGLGLLRLNPVVQDAVQKFVAVYDHQGNGSWHETPERLLNALQLYNLTKISIGEHLRNSRIPERFIHEVAASIGRVNYGQNTDTLNALAGSISLSADSKSLWSVEGGNQRVCEALLQRINASLHLDAQVSSVSRVPGSQPAAYTVEWLDLQTGTTSSAVFDAVVLAAPQELAGVTLHNFAPPPPPSKGRQFWTTHATFVKGSLRPSAVGLKPPAVPPSIILTSGLDRLLCLHRKAPCCSL